KLFSVTATQNEPTGASNAMIHCRVVEPVWHLLEGSFALVLANASEIHPFDPAANDVGEAMQSITSRSRQDPKAWLTTLHTAWAPSLNAMNQRVRSEYKASSTTLHAVRTSQILVSTSVHCFSVGIVNSEYSPSPGDPSQPGVS